MMELIGKTTINPFLFFSGKNCGYLIWVYLLISLFTTENINQINPQMWAALVFLLLGLVLTGVSLVNLGKSVRLGIPKEETVLKTFGIYKISRNPMYVGFNLFSLSAVLFSNNPVVLVMGLYAIFVYHLIILAEENFLENRFSEEFVEYKKKVRRYI